MHPIGAGYPLLIFDLARISSGYPLRRSRVRLRLAGYPLFEPVAASSKAGYPPCLLYWCGLGGRVSRSCDSELRISGGCPAVRSRGLHGRGRVTRVFGARAPKGSGLPAFRGFDTRGPEATDAGASDRRSRLVGPALVLAQRCDRFTYSANSSFHIS